MLSLAPARTYGPHRGIPHSLHEVEPGNRGASSRADLPYSTAHRAPAIGAWTRRPTGCVSQESGLSRRSGRSHGVTERSARSIDDEVIGDVKDVARLIAVQAGDQG